MDTLTSLYKDIDLTKVYIQIGFTNSYTSRKLHKVNKKINISHYDFKKNHDEMIKKSINDNFIQPWLKYTYPGQINEYDHYISHYFKKEYSWKITIEDSITGLISLFPSTDCKKKSVTQVGWVWIEKTLSKNARCQIQITMNNIIAQNKKEDIVQAGVALFNWPSIKFFLKMGFHPKCLHIKKILS